MTGWLVFSVAALLQRKHVLGIEPVHGGRNDLPYRHWRANGHKAVRIELRSKCLDRFSDRVDDAHRQEEGGLTHALG